MDDSGLKQRGGSVGVVLKQLDLLAVESEVNNTNWSSFS
jgi:hypothetical protein